MSAGEVRKMPVAFVIDPKVPRDIETVTLSYVFFELNGPDGGKG
jgi:cytochrome c oxidase assembly protein subunit 11